MSNILTAGDRQIDLSSPVCMGILNITPDSFSDGAQLGESSGARFAVNIEKVLRRAELMVSEGAQILDIGGESTRPGAATVSVEEELERVIPVISSLRSRFDCLLSIDTSNAQVMRTAIAEGAELVNDVRALSRPQALATASESNVAVCLMHMQGQPHSMQRNIAYNNVVTEVVDFLQARMQVCKASGIAADRLIVDPGFGFGKTPEHNYALLKHISSIVALGAPVLVGVSRKSMIGAATGRPVNERLAGSIAATSLALLGGVKIIRTHDVAATMDAIRVHSHYSQA